MYVCMYIYIYFYIYIYLYLYTHFWILYLFRLFHFCNFIGTTFGLSNLLASLNWLALQFLDFTNFWVF